MDDCLERLVVGVIPSHDWLLAGLHSDEKRVAARTRHEIDDAHFSFAVAADPRLVDPFTRSWHEIEALERLVEALVLKVSSVGMSMVAILANVSAEPHPTDVPRVSAWSHTKPPRPCLRGKEGACVPGLEQPIHRRVPHGAEMAEAGDGHVSRGSVSPRAARRASGRGRKPMAMRPMSLSSLGSSSPSEGRRRHQGRCPPWSTQRVPPQPDSASA